MEPERRNSPRAGSWPRRWSDGAARERWSIPACSLGLEPNSLYETPGRSQPTWGLRQALDQLQRIEANLERTTAEAEAAAAARRELETITHELVTLPDQAAHLVAARGDRLRRRAQLEGLDVEFERSSRRVDDLTAARAQSPRTSARTREHARTASSPDAASRRASNTPQPAPRAPLPPSEARSTHAVERSHRVGNDDHGLCENRLARDARTDRTGPAGRDESPQGPIPPRGPAV